MFLDGMFADISMALFAHMDKLCCTYLPTKKNQNMAKKIFNIALFISYVIIKRI